MTDENEYLIPDPAQFDLERQKLARRRKIAEELIGTPYQGMTGADGGVKFAAPGVAGIGTVLSRLAGQLENRQADQGDAALVTRETQAANQLLGDIPKQGEEGRAEAQARAMRMPSLRDTIKAQMISDEAYANRVDTGS